MCQSWEETDDFPEERTVNIQNYSFIYTLYIYTLYIKWGFQNPHFKYQHILHLGSLDSPALFSSPNARLTVLFCLRVFLYCWWYKISAPPDTLKSLQYLGSGSRVGRRAFGGALQPGSLLPRDFSHASYSWFRKDGSWKPKIQAPVKVFFNLVLWKVSNPHRSRETVVRRPHTPVIWLQWLLVPCYSQNTCSRRESLLVVVEILEAERYPWMWVPLHFADKTPPENSPPFFTGWQPLRRFIFVYCLTFKILKNFVSCLELENYRRLLWEEAQGKRLVFFSYKHTCTQTIRVEFLKKKKGLYT